MTLQHSDIFKLLLIQQNVSRAQILRLIACMLCYFRKPTSDEVGSGQ